MGRSSLDRLFGGNEFRMTDVNMMNILPCGISWQCPFLQTVSDRLRTTILLPSGKFTAGTELAKSVYFSYVEVSTSQLRIDNSHMKDHPTW